MSSTAVAYNYTHLHDIASFIPDLDDVAGIELLIERDLVIAHHVFDLLVGDEGLSSGQK